VTHNSTNVSHLRYARRLALQGPSLLVPLILLGALAGSCQSIDGDGFHMTIMNDTPQYVVLYYCDPALTCGELGDGRVLQAGESFGITMYAAHPEFVRRYLVQKPDASVAGCLRLAYQDPLPGAQVKVSQLEPCPEDHRTP
jgi:hypothetical protein